MAELTPIIKDGFLQFAGAVLQSRALVDARDCIKPSARQIFYCLYTDKFVHSKPYQKTLKAIGSTFRMYIHGDSSAEGVIMRASQPFAMRYPLVEVEGSYGTLLSSGSWAAPRYTSARLSALSEYLFKDIQKDTIEEWRDNYDNTEQYPMVLPSKGFFNLVNGAYGIGVGCSSSIPQYNLRELNAALIKLLWNPDIDFDEIYVAPDFATGAILVNAEQVKESHRAGTGFACKLRSVVEFDAKERCFIVTEIPYMLYTETICKELEEIVNGDQNPGIDRFNDLTGETPLIKIYLSKAANPDKVLKYLYTKTSLQSHYAVNFTMLENGRFPRVFTWKEILQAHLMHERQVYVNGFSYDLHKISDRLHILEGLIKAIGNIEEVIRIVKEAADTKNASLGLQRELGFTEPQAKAILEIKLSRLAHMEVSKLIKEQTDLIKERDRIAAILSDENLLKKEIEAGLREVADKFGDARRTKVLNIEKEDDEPTEIRSLLVSLTNENNIFVNEQSSLYTQRRGGVGSKFKLDKGEVIISSFNCQTCDSIVFFTQGGQSVMRPASEFTIGEKISLFSMLPITDKNSVCAAIAINKNTEKQNLIFITKHGILKKSLVSEYNSRRSGLLKAIELGVGDSIVTVLPANEERIGILSAGGNLLICETKDIRPIGRAAKGVVGQKLGEDDYVIAAHLIDEATQQIVSISHSGLIKRTELKEFPLNNRAAKGSKVQKFTDKDFAADFIPISIEREIVVSSSKAQIKIDITSIPELGKATMGVKAIKLADNDHIVQLSKI